MARRRQEGEVVVREHKRGRQFALRFRAYGERRYLTLGYEGEGEPPWDAERADEELKNILADVRRNLWTPPPRKKKKPATALVAGLEIGEGGDSEPILLGPFAKGVVEDRKGRVSDSQHDFREWGLRHLIPFFGEDYLLDVDNVRVDAYVAHKVKEAERLAAAIDRGRPLRDPRGRIRRPLAASSINKTVDILQWILGIAVEYKKRTGVTENEAAGKARRLVEPENRPVHLDTAEQIDGLLVACAELDREPRYHCSEREAMVATLLFAGPRAHELCNLLWRDVDLLNERIFIGRSKTAAGLREIPMLPALRKVLVAHKARAYRTGPDDLVFPTGTGGRRDKDNLRSRVIAAALRRADQVLLERDHLPLPLGITPHKLRHTFASILVAIGKDPRTVMEALGHTDPKFTLKVYTHMMARGDEERRRLKALVAGERVLAVDAPLPEVVALDDYEVPILRGLAELGGKARKREVVQAVGEEFAGRHGTRDLERLPSGQPRWKPRVGKAWIGITQKGWIEAGGARGEWKLTKIGRAKLARSPVASTAASRNAEVPPPADRIEAPEPGLRLVA
jgi:integrase